MFLERNFMPMARGKTELINVPEKMILITIKNNNNNNKKQNENSDKIKGSP